MKRSTFLKSMILAVTAPAVIVTATAPTIPSSLTDRIKAWCKQNGKTLQQTKLFTAWYVRTLNYWLKELKTHGNTFFMNKDRVKLLERFEGQTCQNLWYQFTAQY